MTKNWYATVKYTNGKKTSRRFDSYKEAVEWERMEGDHVSEFKVKTS